MNDQHVRSLNVSNYSLYWISYDESCVIEFYGLELVHEYEVDKLEILCITSNKELAIAGSFGIIKSLQGRV